MYIIIQDMRCSLIDKIENQKLHHTPTPKISRAYLLGALHDSTKSRYTYRICQKYPDYIQLLSEGIKTLGCKSWTYKEGKERNLYVVEFGQGLLKGYTLSTLDDKIDYVRGYFDSEGSVPRNISARYYIYFA
ncbi:MAG: hypothetical protein UW82_C0007G0008, partial [candidate division WWE3 bacterium GW2011_GWC2_44_9]